MYDREYGLLLPVNWYMISGIGDGEGAICFPFVDALASRRHCSIPTTLDLLDSLYDALQGIILARLISSPLLTFLDLQAK